VSLQTWGETLISAQVDGTALNTSTTATSILPPAAKFTLPANFYSIGKVLRVVARGRISNIVTSPGTITLDVRHGSAVVFNGGAVSMNTTAKTNVSWTLEALLTCRSIGSTTTATLLGMGTFTSESVVGAGSGTTLTASLPASAPAVGTGFDSTASQQVDLFAAFSVSNAANSIQLHHYTLEALN
jgi:hypothetical protein